LLRLLEAEHAWQVVHSLGPAQALLLLAWRAPEQLCNRRILVAAVQHSCKSQQTGSESRSKTFIKGTLVTSAYTHMAHKTKLHRETI
jgi:hypothetical protein